MNEISGLVRGLVFTLAMSALGRADEPKPANTITAPQSATQADPREPAGDTQHPTLQRRNPRYQLCKSDVLELSFPLTPEFNQTVTVQPDGYVTLIGAGDIHVEGDTVAEVTEAIRSAYGKILHEPIVSIHLRDFERPYFVVGGEVGHPGKYDLRGDTTVVQAIAISGGFTDAAKHSKVWLFRRVSNDWVETRNLDVKKMLTTGNLSEDLHLRPGDMLYVPKSALAKIKHYLPVTSTGLYFTPIP